MIARFRCGKWLAGLLRVGMCAGLCLGGMAKLSAQAMSGNLGGTVTDPSGDIMPSTSVETANPSPMVCKFSSAQAVAKIREESK